MELKQLLTCFVKIKVQSTLQGFACRTLVPLANLRSCMVKAHLWWQNPESCTMFAEWSKISATTWQPAEDNSKCARISKQLLQSLQQPVPSQGTVHTWAAQLLSLQEVNVLWRLGNSSSSVGGSSGVRGRQVQVQPNMSGEGGEGSISLRLRGGN